MASFLFSSITPLPVIILASTVFTATCSWAELSVYNDENSPVVQMDKQGNEKFDEYVNLKRAADSGDPQAMFKFGVYFYQNQNASGARKWWLKAAESGLSEAQLALATMYRDGDGGPRDETKASYWFHEAAVQGDARAQNEMGVIYWHGEGEYKDRIQAGTWLEKAAKNGSEDAEVNLGFFYLNDDQGVSFASSPEEIMLDKHFSVSKEKAFQWFCKAAIRGSSKAQFKVGEAYSNGDGTDINKGQAKLWLIKAAQQQEPDAIAWLKESENESWYNRLENWFKEKFADKSSGIANCLGKQVE